MHPHLFLQQLWEGEETDTVFVAMSFADKYRSRFDDVFEPAISRVRANGVALSAIRVDESKTGDSIITDIVRGIAQARMVLVDISVQGTSIEGANPIRNGNVMYELGLAHAAKTPGKVVIVRDDREKLLFDISSIPHTQIDFSDAQKAQLLVADLLVDRLTESAKIEDNKLPRPKGRGIRTTNSGGLRIVWCTHCLGS